MEYPTFKEKQKTLFKRQSDLRDKPTPAEQEFKRLLDQQGIKYIFQKAFLKDYYCIVDFYLPKPYKICIEIDGSIHDTDEQMKKDYWRDKYLQSRGFRVIRIRNENVFKPQIINLLLLNLKDFLK